LFNALGTLSTSGHKNLASIGKAAAITGATIDAYTAVAKAFATVPYPANYVAAAAAGITGFATVAKISGVALVTYGISAFSFPIACIILGFTIQFIHKISIFKFL
jgi:hypothetical protein